MFVLGERDYKGCEAAHKVNEYNYKHTLSIMHTMLRLSVKSSEILPAERLRRRPRARERLHLPADFLGSLEPTELLGPTELTWRDSA